MSTTTDIITETQASPASAGIPPTLGQPQTPLEIGDPSSLESDTRIYPSGLKLWLALSSVLMVSLAKGLVSPAVHLPIEYLNLTPIKDTTIVAVAVPSLTDEFKTVNDIGWYSAASYVPGHVNSKYEIRLTVIPAAFPSVPSPSCTSPVSLPPYSPPVNPPPPASANSTRNSPCAPSSSPPPRSSPSPPSHAPSPPAPPSSSSAEPSPAWPRRESPAARSTSSPSSSPCRNARSGSASSAGSSRSRWWLRRRWAAR